MFAHCALSPSLSLRPQPSPKGQRTQRLRLRPHRRTDPKYQVPACEINRYDRSSQYFLSFPSPSLPPLHSRHPSPSFSRHPPPLSPQHQNDRRKPAPAPAPAPSSVPVPCPPPRPTDNQTRDRRGIWLDAAAAGEPGGWVEQKEKRKYGVGELMRGWVGVGGGAWVDG